MEESNRFLGNNSGENTAASSILKYLKESIEEDAEIDLEYVKETIDTSNISPGELEEIRGEAIRGARKYGEQAYRDPKNRLKIFLSGTYSAIASHTAISSGYRHSPNSKSLEPGD